MFQSMHYIYEVYKEMSFSRAAKKLYISQPSLSAAVKKAEDRMGFPIFDRSTSPIQLTEFGKEYIRSAEIIMDVEKGFASYINDLNELKSGSLLIGGTNFFISFVLPPLLRRFTEQYPSIRIELVEGTSAELTEKLNSGALDLLLDYGTLDIAGFSKKTLGQEHLLMAVPASFPSNQEVKNYALTARDIKTMQHLNSRIAPVPMSGFREDPFLLLREGNDTRERAMNICRHSHFVPRVTLEPEQQITAYHLACCGMGICFVGDSLIRTVQESPELLFYKMDGRDTVRDICFYYKRNRYMTKAMSAFLEAAEATNLISSQII